MPDTYTTIQGETWDSICYGLGWPETYCGELMKANPELIGVVFFSAGVVLTLPDPPDPELAAGLPPWKE